MKEYTQQELDDLISCEKDICDPPKKDMRKERGSRRNNMRLRGRDGSLEFSVFMRINEDFPEDFSIGLEYHPQEERGSICLLRCNGPHGDFLGSPIPSSHFHYHIHKAKSQNLASGLRAERGGEVTDTYASYDQALHHFLRVIHAVNAEEYFPGLQAPLLPFPEKEGETQS